MPITRIPKPPPASDDSPAPLRKTHQRAGNRLHHLAERLAALALDFRAEVLFLDECEGTDELRALERDLAETANQILDRAHDVRTGKIPIRAELLDTMAGRGERPIIDAIEDREKVQAESLTAEGAENAERKAEKRPRRTRRQKEKSLTTGRTEDTEQNGRVITQPAEVITQPAEVITEPSPNIPTDIPLWQNVPVASLSLSAVLKRKLVDAGIMTAGDIDRHGKLTTPWPESITEQERQAAYLAVMELQREIDARREAQRAGAPVTALPSRDNTPDPPAIAPAPPVRHWMVFTGPTGGPFRRVCRVPGASLDEAIANAKTRIGWQVYNFPDGLVIDDGGPDRTDRAMVRMTFERDWMPVEEREPYGGDSEPVSIAGNGRDQVPEVCPEGEPHVYEAVEHVPAGNGQSKRVVRGQYRATSTTAQHIADLLWRNWPEQTIAVRRIKEETAARKQARRERGKRALDYELERSAMIDRWRVEDTAPEPETAEESEPVAAASPKRARPARRRKAANAPVAEGATA